jgi:Xaa-Pro aminopeptidase
MVITVEPGIYVPEGSACDQKYWNTGIRIEDDVLVTDDGREVISLGAPRSSADIERAMKAKGVGNVPLGGL